MTLGPGSSVRTFDVRFVRNFTVEPVEFLLRRAARGFGVEAAVTFGEFAGAAAEIAALPQAPAGDLLVLALALETTSAEFGHAGWAAREACEHHLMLVRSAVANSRVPVVINTLLPPPFPHTGLAVLPDAAGHAEIVEATNLELRAIARAAAGRVALVDWVAIARELGHAGTYDHRLRHTAGAPFAAPFLKAYAERVASVVRALCGRTRKCIVLDCDNTLWGGIVGEDGRDGIALSSDTLPGAYYQAFQRDVLDLHARGVIVALCSKNDERDVLAVLDEHPDCLLRRRHLAAWRVDWNDKSRSLVALAAELNIGLDAMVFVDDSDVECSLVRDALPDVETLLLPSAPEARIGLLGRSGLFDALVVTADDVTRGRTYVENRERAELSSSIGDLSEYKRRLGTVLTVREATAADGARVAQLVQRTNQFNLTGRRHDAAAIARFIADPTMLVLCADLSDRFGDLGTIGVAILRHDGAVATVDSMMLSCRALGRDAELAFAAAMYRRAAGRWGVDAVAAEYVSTGRNDMAAGFWPAAGLAPVGDAQGRFASAGDLESLASRIMPPHVAVAARFAEG